MNVKVEILIFIGFLLVSCAPETATQENKVEVMETATVSLVTEAPMTQEAVLTEGLVATEEPTVAPTETSIACVTLLAPDNGAAIPPVGKVTFSWTAMDEAEKYALNIILPSGEIVSFETDQTFRDRFMEAFIAGGEYQWQVIAQGTDGNEICVSEFSTFKKPAYEQSKQQKGGSDDDGNPWVPPTDDPNG